MQLDATGEKALVVEAIPGPLAALLRILPDTAGEGVGSASHRFFPSPGDLSETDLVEDWEEYIKPELHHLFASARETVAKDVAGMTARNEHGTTLWRLSLPRTHIPAWINCLNQARLAIAEAIGYTEADQHRNYQTAIPNGRHMKIYQMDFYALLQQWLLDAEERSSGSGSSPADG